MNFKIPHKIVEAANLKTWRVGGEPKIGRTHAKAKVQSESRIEFPLNWNIGWFLLRTIKY